ncbi:MAG TPA: hypothetical protein VKG25_21185 [Bryobacteraceae bacterium]|nr:hypothetical protein [Bryobacteraceae bacterium]
MRRVAILALTLRLLPAADLKPETAAAFDRYVKPIEAVDEHDFLWLDRHPKEKSTVWLYQSVITPRKRDNATAPDGLIQDWLGTTFLSDVKLEKVRDVVLDFANYKVRFKQQISESKLEKRDGDHFDASLRLHKRQVQNVVLDANFSAQYTLLEPKRAIVICRSTRIVPQGEERGYLWRLNLYWRLEEADNGVYIEVEVVSLSSQPGMLDRGRLLNGFVQKFPHEFTEGIIEGLQQAFPYRR